MIPTKLALRLSCYTYIRWMLINNIIDLSKYLYISMDKYGIWRTSSYKNSVGISMEFGELRVIKTPNMYSKVLLPLTQFM